MKLMCIIMRGLPGSGKSYVAQRLAAHFNAIIASADDYFSRSRGEYNFYRYQLPQAHAACRRAFVAALESGRSVILDNTCSRVDEYESYVQLAQSVGYDVFIVELFHDSFEDLVAFHDRNQHGVDWSVMMAMASRWEDDPCALLIRSSDIVSETVTS